MHGPLAFLRLLVHVCFCKSVDGLLHQVVIVNVTVPKNKSTSNYENYSWKVSWLANSWKLKHCNYLASNTLDSTFYWNFSWKIESCCCWWWCQYYFCYYCYWCCCCYRSWYCCRWWWMWFLVFVPIIITLMTTSILIIKATIQLQ